jgi:hypothetical protein
MKRHLVAALLLTLLCSTAGIPSDGIHKSQPPVWRTMFHIQCSIFNLQCSTLNMIFSSLVETSPRKHHKALRPHARRKALQVSLLLIIFLTPKFDARVLHRTTTMQS